MGLLLYYPFSAGNILNGKIADFRSGSPSYDATLNNGAEIVGDELQLSAGLRQYLTLPPFPTGNVGLSFSCWFLSSSSVTNNYAPVFDFGDGRNANNIILSMINGNLVVTLLVGSVSSSLNTGFQVADNVWYHVCWVLETSGIWTVYVDGQVESSQTGLTYPTVKTRSSNYIGRSNWPTRPYFDGAVRDFRSYGRSLSAAEVNLLFSTTQVTTLCH